MSTRHDAWTALRHGGNLLSPAALDALPDPDPVRQGLADRLRSALVAFDPERPKSEALGALLDVVLEDAAAITVGWRKGSALGAADAQKLLDGTVLKPRRLWTGPDGDALAVFTDPAQRLGVGRGRRPVARVTEYLRRRNVPLALLTNGQQWRLIWADTDATAWVEWDADRWLDADQLTGELHILRQVLSWPALTRGAADHSPLLAAIRDTRRGQARLSKELGERVRRAVEILLKSRAPLVGPAWDEHTSADLYVAASHFVMRMVVTLFAEARELLPADNPVYHHAYGLRGLIDQLDRLTSERRKGRQMAWPRLLGLFRLLHQGSLHPQLQVNAYGGDLFRPGDASGDGVQRALALLEALPEPPDDDTIHRILVLLTRTSQRVREGAGWRTVAAPVDFTELTSEYIGILYEGLLDYELHRAGEHPVVFLNLGDQPALPLDRLEEMDDKALFALVEKAKVKKQAASEDEGEDGEEDDDSEENEEDADKDSASDEGDAAVAEDDETPDDARAQARARATAWGRRAAVLAKLVKKPAGRLNPEKQTAFDKQLDSAAGQLVADLKLPGELYLVRWGGTRKGAGTFYTRPQLTLPTVRRTLEPLLRDETGAARSPEDLLALKVCDPAMGSGSFLVAALRVLTAAVVEALHVHDRIHAVNGRTSVACELVPEADRSLPTEGFEDRLEAVVRRAVVEHCLYGVDKDPLAVELARVALWVETLDRDLPFTFLDHKLRCGDSLVGTWLDRFRDYPLLAFDRQSPDKGRKGVHHPADVWHQALKDKRAQAIADQVDLLGGKQDWTKAQASDEKLRQAVDRVRRLYRELRAISADRPDERARIWRTRIQADAALARVREAFDAWCALWFWPLDRLDLVPLPSQFATPSEAAQAVVRELRDTRRFFHWEIEFPDVFIELGAGFDAVVGNPPWEIQKPSSQEFFSNIDPLFRTYGKQAALRAQQMMFDFDPSVESAWLHYLSGFKEMVNYVNNAAEPFGDGPTCGKGGVAVTLIRGIEGERLHRTWRTRRDRYTGCASPQHPFLQQGVKGAGLNSYKLFFEQMFNIASASGHIGGLFPSGLYADAASIDLRDIFLGKTGGLRYLFAFENREQIFDIHSSFKFCVCVAGKGQGGGTFSTAFMERRLEAWSTLSSTLRMTAAEVLHFSPWTHAFVEIRTQGDLAVFAMIYRHSVMLGGEEWGVDAGREFNMTDDSRAFVRVDEAEAKGWREDSYGRWWSEGSSDCLLPLYQGVMVGHHTSSRARWIRGSGRQTEWDKSVPPHAPLRPQFLVAREVAAYAKPAGLAPRILFRCISNSTNERTFVGAWSPAYPAGHSLMHLCPDAPEAAKIGLSAVLSSFCYDWAARQRITGTNLSWSFLAETPVPTPDACMNLSIAALRLTATRETFAGTWLDLLAPPRKGPWRRLWAITPHERLRLRCMLDAIVAVLYGLDRDDFAWILKDCDHPTTCLADRAFARQLDPKGFWRVDKTEDPELRHTVLSLAAFDDLQAAIAAAGDRDAGIQAFCDQHDGDGWMLPETLCLADLALTRTVGAGTYDDRARQPQPVRARMGPRFLDWQLAQSVEESWAECERHAKAILEGTPAPAEATAKDAPPPAGARQGRLFE